MSKRLDKLKEKNKPEMGRPKHEATEENKIRVEAMMLVGLQQANIAKHLGISTDTLTKYYSDQIEHGVENMNTQVASALFTNAIKGNVAAQIFWCKTRLGWKETQVQEMVIPQIILQEEDAS